MSVTGERMCTNRLGDPSLPRESCFRFTDRPDMRTAVYHGRKTITKQLLHAEFAYFDILATPVRTTRPEKCDIFSQRYQSQPIKTKFQKHS